MIDITNCIGCRKGISLFTLDKGEYNHLDLFYSHKAGSSFKCLTLNIGEYLIENEGRGMYIPNEDMKSFFSKQEIWWDDIINLLHDLYKDPKLVTEFFNQSIGDIKTWNLPNIEIENKVLLLAQEKGIVIEREDYPDLIKWKIED